MLPKDNKFLNMTINQQQFFGGNSENYFRPQCMLGRPVLEM